MVEYVLLIRSTGTMGFSFLCSSSKKVMKQSAVFISLGRGMATTAFSRKFSTGSADELTSGCIYCRCMQNIFGCMMYILYNMIKIYDSDVQLLYTLQILCCFPIYDVVISCVPSRLLCGRSCSGGGVTWFSSKLQLWRDGSGKLPQNERKLLLGGTQVFTEPWFWGWKNSHLGRIWDLHRGFWFHFFGIHNWCVWIDPHHLYRSFNLGNLCPKMSKCRRSTDFFDTSTSVVEKVKLPWLLPNRIPNFWKLISSSEAEE